MDFISLSSFWIFPRKPPVPQPFLGDPPRDVGEAASTSIGKRDKTGPLILAVAANAASSAILILCILTPNATPGL